MCYAPCIKFDPFSDKVTLIASHRSDKEVQTTLYALIVPEGYEPLSTCQILPHASFLFVSVILIFRQNSPVYSKLSSLAITIPSVLNALTRLSELFPSGHSDINMKVFSSEAVFLK